MIGQLEKTMEYFMQIDESTFSTIREFENKYYEKIMTLQKLAIQNSQECWN